MLQLYRSPIPPPLSSREAAEFLKQHINFMRTSSGDWSAADLLLAVLGVEPQIIDGPITRGTTSYRSGTVPRALFENAKSDAISYIRTFHRLPSEIFVGPETLSLADFAATAAGNDNATPSIQVRHGLLDFENYFSNDPRGAFKWPIHPKDFAAPNLLALARLQGWTLKPARLQ